MATRLSQYRSVGPALVEQRAAERHRIIVSQATLRSHSEEPVEATLHDLSVYGCRLACSTEHQQGERLWLRLKGTVPVAATVVWNDGNHIGCRFDAPIERSLMRSLTLVIC
ncbi:PilZ domain-containing protein [Sphingomonas sp. DT-207]|uniref:PilZ domain-containing protein n=1 Tax=Sphingomonas sp. DT-207 TaxID=3396167 RepID=UPI003F1BE9F1